ncbi:MAG TPA: transposase [Acidimicrobiales bacterium]
METRTIGIDLGIASAHTSCVVDASGKVICKRQTRPTLESLTDLESAALAGAPPDTKLSIVMEPTGAAWLPVAVFFIRRGHLVYRVASSKASDLRKFLIRHAKTNSIDALTLAKIPIIDQRALIPLELDEGAAASLRRRVRAADRLRDQASRHKTRIRELVRQMMPALDGAIAGELRMADVVVLERYADPRILAKLPLSSLTRLIAKETGGGLAYAERKAQGWISSAQSAMDLYGDDPAVPFADLAAEVATEIALLHVIDAEMARHAAAREEAYLKVDPQELARSLPGVGSLGGPAIVAAMARPGRFPSAKSFRRYTGLAPKASETGNSDAKGQAMSKAGASWLRDQLVMSANVARKIDPELAQIYYVHMVERGAHHNKAVCIVASHLATRAWTTLGRGTPYVLRDVDGTPITVAQGKAIVGERYEVTEEVRRRRRTKKVGKAPHESRKPRSGRGDLPRTSSFNPDQPTVKVLVS